MDQIQKLQAGEYSFPYHYLPVFEREKIRLARHWSWAPSYLAALKLIALWIEAKQPEPGHKHIDFGCGDGALCHYLSRYFADHSSINWTGIDYDGDAIAWARIMNGKSIKYIDGDIAELPIESFDGATLVEVAEHISPESLPSFVAAMHKVLKPEATLFVTVPHSNIPVQDKHYQHFTFTTLKSVFGSHFDFVEVHGFARHSFTSKFVQRIIANNKWVFTWEPLSTFVVGQLAKKHTDEVGVSRICAVLKRKS